MNDYDRIALVIRYLDQCHAEQPDLATLAKYLLAYLIPCHRVIRETGVAGDYRWGQVRKRAILVWESSTRSTV